MTVYKTDTFIYDVVFDGVKSIIKGISVSLFFIFFMNKKKPRVEEFCGADRNKKHVS